MSLKSEHEEYLEQNKFNNLKQKYYDYKNSVDNNYAGGLISEITDYVNYLERKIEILQSINADCKIEITSLQDTIEYLSINDKEDL